MITWGIWHQQNQVRNHKPCCTSDQLASQAKEKLVEFPPTYTSSSTKTEGEMDPPDTSFFKINFDGAIFRNENKSGIGVVVRDHTSSIIASLSQHISPALQLAEIEAVARAL